MKPHAQLGLLRRPLRGAAIAAGVAALAGGAARAELVFGATEVRLRAAAEDRVVVARFPFRNSGAAPLVVTALQASCGCVAPAVARPDVGPGETGEVVARFAPGTASGVASHTVTVVTHDGAAERRQTLTLRVELPAAAVPAVAAGAPAIVAPAQLVWLRRPFVARTVVVDLAAAAADGCSARAEPAKAFEVRVEPDSANAKLVRVHVTPRGDAPPRTAELVVVTTAADGARATHRVALKVAGAAP